MTVPSSPGRTNAGSGSSPTVTAMSWTPEEQRRAAEEKLRPTVRVEFLAQPKTHVPFSQSGRRAKRYPSRFPQPRHTTAGCPPTRRRSARSTTARLPKSVTARSIGPPVCRQRPHVRSVPPSVSGAASHRPSGDTNHLERSPARPGRATSGDPRKSHRVGPNRPAIGRRNGSPPHPTCAAETAISASARIQQSHRRRAPRSGSSRHRRAPASGTPPSTGHLLDVFADPSRAAE